MSSSILMATVTAIALSTPAWAHDPAKAPIDTEIRAILLDPAEAPIDTEMKIILWLETLEGHSRDNTAGSDGAVATSLRAARTGPTMAEHQPAPTTANVAAE